MKKRVRIVAIFLLFTFHFNTNSQTQNISENGLFDHVQDNLGNSYQLADLWLYSSKTLGGSSNITSAPPTVSCQAGYFRLFYAPGSYLAGSISAQVVVCEVFSNLSGFIYSNIPPGSINIYCEDTPPSSPKLGQALSLFVFPSSPANTYQGVIHNLVQKALLTGVDPFTNIPMAVFSGSNSLYHGRLQINPSPSGGTWNLNMATLSTGATVYDLYSAVLHEAIHLLGVESLISQNGTSQLVNNYYSKYDQFLFDLNGNPLIAPSSTSCPTSSLSFVASTLAISPTACSSTITNISTCTSAVQYISSNVNLKVYTPDCFEGGSSLSHFEDMCGTSSFTPSGPPSCTPVPSSPGYNDLYFAMSNSSSPGTCYVKRFLKPEEKCVLCDLGYSVGTVYSSNAVLSGNASFVNYGTSCSSTPQIIGMNDGLVSGTYIFTTTTGVFTTNINQLLTNDIYTTALQVSCLEVISNSASASMTGTLLTVNALSGSGICVLKYYPTNGSGLFGNATFVYVYFLSPGCNPSGLCNMIENGGFEQFTTSLNDCGPFYSGGPLSVPCWTPLYGTPMFLGTTCNSISIQYLILGNNTFSSTPPISALNLSPNTNDHCVALMISQTNVNSNAIKNRLTVPLINGNTYQISFFAINLQATNVSTLIMPSINPSNTPIVLTVASYTAPATVPTINFPSGLDIITQFTLPAGNQWQKYTYTFTYNIANPGNALIFGIDPAQAPSGTNYADAIFLDEIVIQPLGPTFSVGQPTACGATGIPNLLQYASTGSGTVSGPGVTFTGTQFDFNIPPTLSTGTHVLTYSYTTGGCLGVLYDEISFPIMSSCCTDTSVPAFGITSVNSSTNIFGQIRVLNDFTVQPGVIMNLSGDVRLSKDVRITVANNAELIIQKGHLYACASEMWQGIDVLDGGKLTLDGNTTGSNLIEDAKTAVNIQNNTTSTVVPILQVDNTTFNKNYISINIENYKRNSTNYPFVIRSTVFTSRSIPFSGINWPQTGTVSSVNTTSADLRYETSSTSGLASPYLGQSSFDVSTLKYPYYNQFPLSAINLDEVGATTTSSFFPLEVGDAGAVSLFNVFDSHKHFISASNSNVKISNCRFQNTIRTGLSSGSAPSFMGAAVTATANIQNVLLDLSAANPSSANKFWNCHYAVHGNNLLRFNITNASIRSTQSNTAISGVQRGNTGIFLGTNRFQYTVKDNEFTNINTCINISIASGVYTSVAQGTVNGIYGHKIEITSNTLSPGTGTTNYVSNGIRISSPNNYPIFYAPDYTVSPNTKGIIVQNNILPSVFRGIYVNGITGLETIVRDNFVELTTDNVFYGTQHGIDFSNMTSGGNLSAQQQIVTNTVSGTYSSSMEALYYSSMNFGLYSPKISCNWATNSYQGFVFSGINTPNGPNVPAQNIIGTQWFGNKMENLMRGMVLTNSAVIGSQGNPNLGSGNIWLGTAWSATNNNTYTLNSDALFSTLYCAIGSGSLYPTYNDGQPNSISFDDPARAPISNSGSGNYSCSDPSAKSSTMLVTCGELSEDYAAIVNCGLYRFLMFNDSIPSADSDLNTFYTGLSGSNIQIFAEIEYDIYTQDPSGALAKIYGITPSNTIESNYKNFYSVYATYLHDISNSEPFISTDSSSLINLAMLCPEENGNCIYQARALYESIFAIIPSYPGCDNGTGARYNQAGDSAPRKSVELRGFKIIPNPNQGEFYLEFNNQQFDELNIYDAHGSLVIQKTLLGEKLALKVSVDLPQGLYEVVLKSIKGNFYNLRMVISE